VVMQVETSLAGPDLFARFHSFHSLNRHAAHIPCFVFDGRVIFPHCRHCTHAHASVVLHPGHVDLLSWRRPCTPSLSSAGRLRSVIIASAIHRHTVLAHSNPSSIHIEHGHVAKQRRQNDNCRFKFEFSGCSRVWDSIPGVLVVARRLDALTAVAHERVR
jgi:hypothetical protein